MEKVITDDMRKNAEFQITETRQKIDYDTRDWSIDFLTKRYRENTLYVPDEYQRKYTWCDTNKNSFIESILLGIPVPTMFFADTYTGRHEIIDGAQRIQTLEEFIFGGLQLSNLKILTKLNGFKFSDLPEYYQRKFCKTTMRIILISDETSVAIRKEVFDRMNSAGKKSL